MTSSGLLQPQTAHNSVIALLIQTSPGLYVHVPGLYFSCPHSSSVMPQQSSSPASHSPVLPSQGPPASGHARPVPSLCPGCSGALWLTCWDTGPSWEASTAAGLQGGKTELCRTTCVTDSSVQGIVIRQLCPQSLLVWIFILIYEIFPSTGYQESHRYYSSFNKSLL